MIGIIGEIPNDLPEHEHPKVIYEADKMMKAMRELKAGVYPIDSRQRDLIKQWWWELHNYDKEHEYVFNDDYTKVKKRTVLKTYNKFNVKRFTND